MTDTKLLDAALAFHAAGCCVVPARPDGSKAPIGQWAEYQKRIPTLEEITAWFTGNDYDGFGLVCGAISGNLELLELEGRALTEDMHTQLTEIADASGLGELWRRVNEGYQELSPNQGMHLLYRVDGVVAGNTKLAQRPGQITNVEVLAETRGEGGYVVVAPSAGRTHPTRKPWILLNGAPEKIPTITAAERDALHILARTLDSMPERETAPNGEAGGRGVPTPKTSSDQRSGASIDGPGAADDYNAKTSWHDLLIPLHWRSIYTAGRVTYWRRPGKDTGISATTGRNDGDNLYVFSTSTLFEQERPYSKFAAYTLLTYGSTSSEAFSQAGKALYAAGYGQRATSGLEELLAEATRPFIADTPTETAPIEPDARADEDALILAHKVRLDRINRLARRILDAEEAAATFREPPWLPTLTDELALPDEPITYAISDLLTTGGNALLTAAYKTGKTTLIGELARAYADEKLFLGRYEVPKSDGRIALFNYEVDARQYRIWLRDLGIVNTDRVAVLHLRGHRLPINAPDVEDWVVDWLTKNEARMWVIDPFARAFVGCGDENDNSHVGVFLDTLDVIKSRAGVNELIMPTHTGRAEMDEGQERARGATRLDDWADVRWILTKDGDENRYFRATGRDVDTPEMRLRYQHTDRSLHIDGGDRRTERLQSVAGVILQIVARVPGISSKNLRDAVREEMTTVANTDYEKARKWLENQGRLNVDRTKSGTGHSHYLPRADGENETWPGDPDD